VRQIFSIRFYGKPSSQIFPADYTAAIAKKVTYGLIPETFDWTLDRATSKYSAVQTEIDLSTPDLIKKVPFRNKLSIWTDTPGYDPKFAYSFRTDTTCTKPPSTLYLYSEKSFLPTSLSLRVSKEFQTNRTIEIASIDVSDDGVNWQELSRPDQFVIKYANFRGVDQILFPDRTYCYFRLSNFSSELTICSMIFWGAHPDSALTASGSIVALVVSFYLVFIY
jgi:hypothetical protein